MKFSTTVTAVFDCSIERAFKTAMLCDITKIHTGFLLSPKVTHTTEDKDWGKMNSNKKVHVAPSIIQKGGFIFMDNILERVENDYWKIRIDHFQTWALGFHIFEGIRKPSYWEMIKCWSNILMTCIPKSPFSTLLIGFL